MSRVLLDHNVDPRIAGLLPDHAVARASREGLHDVSNGDLIRVANALGYDVLLTKDRKMRHQNNPHTALPVIVLECGNPFSDLTDLAPAINKLLQDSLERRFHVVGTEAKPQSGRTRERHGPPRRNVPDIGRG